MAHKQTTLYVKLFLTFHLNIWTLIWDDGKKEEKERGKKKEKKKTRRTLVTEAVRDISRMDVQERSADWPFVRDMDGQIGGLVM